MGENNGPALLEQQQQHKSTDRKTMWQKLKMLRKPQCRGATLQQVKVKLSAWLDSAGGHLTQHRQLAHYLSLLCFLLVIVALLQTLCLAQLTLVFQSQSTLQEAKLRDLTDRLQKLNRSYNVLFSRYPALNQYCPVSNATTGERVCRPCAAGWTPQGEKCFLFSQDRADWISSQYRCMAAGGAVATVRTEEEEVFVWNQAQSLSQGDSYWLGLRSSEGDGGWRWSDGSLVEKGPQFWAREPAGGDGRELCGRLSPGDDHRRSWFTSRCSNLLRRICERRQASLQ